MSVKTQLSRLVSGESGLLCSRWGYACLRQDELKRHDTSLALCELVGAPEAYASCGKERKQDICGTSVRRTWTCVLFRHLSLNPKQTCNMSLYEISRLSVGYLNNVGTGLVILQNGIGGKALFDLVGRRAGGAPIYVTCLWVSECCLLRLALWFIRSVSLCFCGLI